jgi:cysteine desulfurase
LTKQYGNPSSSHGFGRAARQILENAREAMAQAINAAESAEIVFTSGGTESTNWAIFSALELKPNKKHLVTTRVEHEVVLRSFEKLETRGYSITYLEVDDEGLFDLDQVRNAITSDTALVSIMAANNETGVLFPIVEIAEIIKDQSDAFFHVDGVQAIGKIPLSLKETAIDFFAVSGHKFHAPKGVGALYIRKGIDLPPLLLGGAQEGKRRAGTENLASVVGLGAACQLIENLDFQNKICSLRNCLENEILQKIPNTRLNGTNDPKLRLPNTSNISFLGIDGESLMATLDAQNVYVSTGSACNSADHQSSSVLRAMNLPYNVAMGATRFSLSRYTTEEEIKSTLRILPEVVEELRKISP